MPVQTSSPSFSNYEFTGTFDLPVGPKGAFPLFDVLNDGRIISTDGDRIYLEKSFGSREFSKIKKLEAGVSSYIRVSPGGKVAVDAGGTVEIFNPDTPENATSYNSPGSYDAEWLDDEWLAISISPSGIVALNVSSGLQVQLVSNIGGSAAGITIDKAKNLYCANGGDSIAGGTQTGWIKAYSQDLWKAVLAGSKALDFETTGILVADLLSAGYLGFDSFGNLLVGGGVFFGVSGDVDGSNEPAQPDKGYAAMVNSAAVKAALAGGSPVDRTAGSDSLHEFDPMPNTNEDFYYVNANPVSQELYLSDYAGQDNLIVYVFSQKDC